MSRQTVVALIVGLLFALGLGISGMAQPERVLAFLDFSGAWDPSLLFVMGGAMSVYGVIYRLVIGGRPRFASRFHLPAAGRIDRRLVLGAALFGAGWGLVGYCPGPGLMSVVAGHAGLVFVGAMMVGMVGAALVPKLFGRRLSTRAPAQTR